MSIELAAARVGLMACGHHRQTAAEPIARGILLGLSSRLATGGDAGAGVVAPGETGPGPVSPRPQLQMNPIGSTR